MADPKWDDTEEIDEVPKFEDTEDIVEDKPYEMGAGEAALTGLGEGATLGLGPILAGIAGAGGEVVEDIGDVLGLSTDAELRDQGFKVEDKEKGLQGLLDAYYKSRDMAIKQQEQAFKDQPVASIGGSIVGSLASMAPAAKAAQALAGTGRAGSAAAKILPKLDDLKGASALQKAGVAAREGAKAGGLAGFGSGEGRLLEGEVGETISDVAQTAVGGAAVGGALSGAASGVSGLAKKLPGMKSFSLGKKIAEEGLGLDEASIKDEIKVFAEDLRNTIQDVFRKNKVQKGDALSFADEIGVRVTEAGEAIDDVIDDLISRGATSEIDQKEKVALLNALNELRGESPRLRKLQQKLDSARAKKAVKLEREKGGEIETSTEINQDFDEVLPLPDSQGKVYGVVDKVKMPDGSDFKISTLQADIDDIIPIKKYNLDDMRLSEMEDLISDVNRYTGDLNAPPKTQVEQKARLLAQRLRNLSNAALESDVNLSDANTKMSRIFTALRKGNVKGNILSERSIIKDEQVDAIRRLILGSGDASEINQERFFQYLQEASSEFQAPAERAQFLNEALELAKNLDVDRTVSFKGLIGSAQGVVAKAGSFVGKLSKSLRDASDKVGDTLTKSAKTLIDITDDDLRDLITSFHAKYNKNTEPFIRPLRQALNASNNRSKQAIMYGLYQQPAFRQILRDLGGEVMMQEDVKSNSLEDTSYDRVLERSQGRSPQSLESVIDREGYAGTLQKTTPYTGLEGTPGARVEGSSDYGLYYDSEGLLTSGYGDLITSEEEAQAKMNQTEEEARVEASKNYEKTKSELETVLRKFNIEGGALSDRQKEGIRDMLFQLGLPKTLRFERTFKLIEQGEYEEAAKEAADSLWNKQTPVRVKDFQERILDTE